jgi:hypothetical protein
LQAFEFWNFMFTIYVRLSFLYSFIWSILPFQFCSSNKISSGFDIETTPRWQIPFTFLFFFLVSRLIECYFYEKESMYVIGQACKVIELWTNCLQTYECASKFIRIKTILINLKEQNNSVLTTAAIFASKIE